MKLVGMVAMSHSPSWDLQTREVAAGPYIDAVMAARARVQALQPDLIVVFGPDHVRNFFFDLMPSFCIGVETVTAFGDFASPKGPMPTYPDLAVQLAEAVMRQGFDPALSYDMGIDHGISQAYAALDPALSALPCLRAGAGRGYPRLS
jgi:2,3-dihydroxyphenylpropionate 1,2-dioxygenase